MAKMERTLVFLDAHITRVWEELQEARKNNKSTATWEHILDNLLDQRINVQEFSQTESAAPVVREGST
jgi:hypothetical protein